MPPSRRPAAQLAAIASARALLALVVVALGSAGFAIIFRLSMHRASAALFGPGSLLEVFRRFAWWQCVLVPMVGGALAYLVLRVSERFKPGATVGEVMEAVAVGHGQMSAPSTGFKALASLLAMGTGSSIGREGPLIQFGGALGSSVARWFSLDERQARMLVAAGTASGFAAAYNTPLAAMLFMVEVVTGVVALEVLLPAGIATALATTLTRSAVGDGPIYGVRTFRLVSEAELLSFAVLGVLAGVAGAAFIKLLGRGEQLAAQVKRPAWQKILAGCFAVGVTAIFLPEVVGNGFEPLSELLSGTTPMVVIALLLVAKPLATALSVSSGLPGGVFTPSLLLGACVGALFGQALGLFGGAHVATPQAYALVGLAALCAATTQAPIMAAVLGFELSGDYAIVLPLVMSCACATWVSRRLQPRSLYQAELERRGLEWEDAPGERRLVKTKRAN